MKKFLIGILITAAIATLIYFGFFYKSIDKMKEEIIEEARYENQETKNVLQDALTRMSDSDIKIVYKRVIKNKSLTPVETAMFNAISAKYDIFT